MLGSEVLEVGVGMLFLFLLVSLICTGVNEWLEGIFKWRAMDLERALRTLLADPDGARLSDFISHPSLDSLFQGKYDRSALCNSPFTPGKGAKHMRLSARRQLPSYIPSAQFATAFLDTLARGPTTASGNVTGDNGQAMTLKSLRESALAKSESPHLQRALLTALDHAADLNEVKRNIAEWFDGTMDRASGWYRRRTQAMQFVLGLVIAIVLNIDAMYIMHRLTIDKAFRDVVVQKSAAAKLADQPVGDPSAGIKVARESLAEVQMPTGWQVWNKNGKVQQRASSWFPNSLVPVQLCGTDNASQQSKPPALTEGCERASYWGFDWLSALAGWLVTAFAVMLGAPFWFDVLNKFMVIRSTVKPQEKSKPEGSEDRKNQAG